MVRRCAAKVDWNDDGALDLIIVHQNDPVAVLTNRHKALHWLSIDLIGTPSERSAIGGKAIVQTDGGATTRWKCSGGSYLSHSDARLLFVRPDGEPADVEVTWLGGETEIVSPPCGWPAWCALNWDATTMCCSIVMS